jgi:hypothetical protein
MTESKTNPKKIIIPDLGEVTAQEILAILGDHLHNPNSRKLIGLETLKFLEDEGHTSGDGFGFLAYQTFHHSLNSSAHNSYWNDRFYVANRFGLGEFEKLTSAVVVLWNGKHDYFEWTTHTGFDNAKLFQELGLIDEYRYETAKGRIGYVRLESVVSERLQRKFAVRESELASAHLLCECVYKKEIDFTNPAI